MKLTCIVEPTATPITIEEAKSFCRILSNDEDATLEILIGAATDYAQNATGRQLCEATYELVTTQSPLILPKAPLKEIVSVQVGGIDLPYTLSWDVDVGMIEFSSTEEVTITYKAGYSTVPSVIKAWMMNRVSTLFEHREAIITGTIVQELPKSVIDSILDQYKVRFL